MEEVKIKLVQGYLDKLIKEQSVILVANIMARFDTFGYKDEKFKKEIKDVFYEHGRNLSRFLNAFINGLESFSFEFKPHKKK